MWVVRATSRGIYVLTTAPLEYTNTKMTQNPGIPGKHHSRLAAMPSPSVAPKLHPAALSPADVTLFPTTTSPGAAEGSEMENPTSSGPLAEGHPDNSFRGLPARPAALY